MEFIDGISPVKRREEESKVIPKFIEEDRQYKKDEVFLYNLTVEGHTKAHEVESDFGITSINELTYIDYDEKKNWWRFRLKELSYNLDRYDDPIIAQIVEMSNKISEIYQELDFWVNNCGELMIINNRAQILKRWEKVREYLTYKHPLSSYEVIMAKEHEMANAKVEINNIRFIHFIHMYFYQFGRFYSQENYKIIDMDRFGSGVSFEVAVNVMRNEINSKNHRHFEGCMINSVDSLHMIRKAVKAKNGEVIYKTCADYYNDGWIVEDANFSFTENIGESHTMYSNLHLTLVQHGR